MNVRHEDKYLYYDTAFTMNNATGSKYRVTYHYINVAVGLQEVLIYSSAFTYQVFSHCCCCLFC